MMRKVWNHHKVAGSVAGLGLLFEGGSEWAFLGHLFQHQENAVSVHLKDLKAYKLKNKTDFFFQNRSVLF